MLRSLQELVREFGRAFRKFNFPTIRHDAPFAKRKAGKLRRQERRTVRRSKEHGVAQEEHDTE